MCGGERPMGAAKGKQSDTEALCHPPPPNPPPQSLIRSPLPPPAHCPRPPPHAEFSEASRTWMELLIALVLSAIVLPAWRLYILPKIMHEAAHDAPPDQSPSQSRDPSVLTVSPMMSFHRVSSWHSGRGRMTLPDRRRHVLLAMADEGSSGRCSGANEHTPILNRQTGPDEERG